MQTDQDKNDALPATRLHDDAQNLTPTALLDTVFIDSIPFDSPNSLLQDRLLSRAYFAAHSAQYVAGCANTVSTHKSPPHREALDRLFNAERLLSGLEEEEAQLDRELHRQATLGEQLVAAMTEMHAVDQ